MVDNNNNEKSIGQENVEHVTIDIDLNLDDGIDPKKAEEYLEKLFFVGDKFGELLHNEGLTIGEALFVIYILEKGALSTMNIGTDDSGGLSHLLLEDNNIRMNAIADFIVKNNKKCNISGGDY